MQITDHDQVFLAKVVELFELIHANEPTLLIDTDGKILFVGKEISRITGIDHNILLGKNHLEVLPLPLNNISAILEAINVVFSSRDTCEFLSVNLNHKYGYSVLHCILKPIINSATNNVVALFVESKKLSSHIYINSILSKIENASISKQNYKDNLLTLREHEVAFLLFYLKSAKKISAMLSDIYKFNFSDKTVANIISAKLYTKFNVYGQEALISKIYECGYHQKIPLSFLSNMFIKLS